MSDRKRNRRRPETSDSDIEDVDKPEKIEYEIAKYLRSKLPPKQTTLLGHKVDYFIASRAIDLIMNSKWAQTDKRTDRAMFSTRESVSEFMNLLLRHKFFHRAKTIIVKKEIKKKQDTDSAEESHKSDNKKSGSGAEKSPEAKKSKKKEKKKVKLDMHMDQIFVDGNEPYVWIYDYIPMKTWLIGGGLVIAAIAICLFPLWPRTVRNYVYYLSIAAAAFLFFIIALAVLKMAVFSIAWLVTFGRHHLWILPNLTEDVGFFESFWPLYKHEYKPKGNDLPNESEILDGKKDEEIEDDKNENVEPDKESEAESVSTTESIHRQSTNGFEILDSTECIDE